MRAEKDRQQTAAEDTQGVASWKGGACTGRPWGQLPWRDHMTQGPNVPMLLCDPVFQVKARSGLGEVVFGSQQLSHHTFQNLSPSGTQKMICSPPMATRALGFAKSHYLTEMGHEMPANCYKI